MRLFVRLVSGADHLVEVDGDEEVIGGQNPPPPPYTQDIRSTYAWYLYAVLTRGT